MSEDHSKIRQNSGDQDAKTEENSGPKTEFEDIDEGYRTPTSEEHKIPVVVKSCPPPPPRKRKRLVVNGKNIRKLDVFRGRIVNGSELELLFESFGAKSGEAPPPPPPPSSPPEPESDLSTSSNSKKRHIDK